MNSTTEMTTSADKQMGPMLEFHSQQRPESKHSPICMYSQEAGPRGLAKVVPRQDVWVLF